MSITFTVGVYQRRAGGEEEWTALVPARHATSISGQGEVRLRERIIEKLRGQLKTARPNEQELFQLPLGTELMRLAVDVKLDETRVHGEIPLIVEPRWTGDELRRLFVYHPLRRSEWYLAETSDEVRELLPAFIRHTWAALDDEDVTGLVTNGKDRLVTVAFSCEPMSLLDQLPSRKKDPRTAASGPRPDRVLRELGVDETHRLSAGTVRLGVPRSPYRERLGYLMSGARPRSVAVVGPPGAGKSSLIYQAVFDRLAQDGYAIHKNLDRVHHVWRLTGKRLIAGMSYLGQWEERCLAILDEVRKYRAILWFDDLHLFGRLGQSRQSERSFADFFRGPVRRGDVAIIAELTVEQHARLERDAPGLAEALALVAVPAASPAETAQLLLHEVRALETRLPNLELHPFVPRTALELGAALFPWRARPGVAIEIVRRVAEDLASRAEDRELMPTDVLEYLARTTGLSAKLITLEEPLDAAEVEAAFAARVIGQPTATRAAADVIVRVRAGLADPGRPINVMLFTGPTGTGKTELATAIAEYLYGDQSRLVRLDMGELSGGDAVARMIGDEGLLTARVRAQPFCVVLLDEIEKAHPQALHLLLQLFDEGRLTDAAGEVASFASAVVIMTSNLGSRNASPIGFGETRDRILAEVAKAVREFFPIELFNRIDHVVPFEPLTPEVAAKVVDKELAKLLARRGLRERNTFVYAGAAVRRRAVADAFDPRYGARTVKRWLEDKVGGALTDLLATAPPARLRIVRLAEHDGAIAATLEPMLERPAIPGTYVLEGALDLATAALEPAIAVAVAALERIHRAPMLARAKLEATDDVRYYVDELLQRLTALGELFHTAPEHHDDDEPVYETRTIVDQGWTKQFRTRLRGPRHTRPPAGRDQLLAGIAETMLIERALPTLLDPNAHAITMVMSRIGVAHAEGLVTVTRAYTNQASRTRVLTTTWFEAGAHADDTGDIGPIGTGKSTSTYEVWRTFWRARRDVALVLRGLFVHAALETDHGTWLVRATTAEPDVVRVEIRAGAPHTPQEVLRAHIAARRELERVLEHGGPLPANPDALLPVTRTITYRAPLKPGEPYPVEVEDFATGWIDRAAVRDLAHVAQRAWHLAWSRKP